MKKLLVEFKLDDTWEAYIPDDEEKLRNLRHDINQDGVETRIIKDQELKDKQFTEMYEALKWFADAMSDGSLIVFTDDDDHWSVPGAELNKDRIDKIYSLVKDIES